MLRDYDDALGYCSKLTMNELIKEMIEIVVIFSFSFSVLDW